MRQNFERYNNVFSDGYCFYPNESLVDFINFYRSLPLAPELIETSLEIGSAGGLHLIDTSYFKDVEALDIVPSAAVHFKSNYPNNFYTTCFLDFNTKKKWDFILDAHLLHCLIGKSSFEQYFKKVYQCLVSGGHLVLEVMCESKVMSFDDAKQSFDFSTGVLYDEYGPVRTILPSMLIEKIIIESGLKIVYLRVDEIIKFIPSSHRSESRPNDPDRMRVICLKE